MRGASGAVGDGGVSIIGPSYRGWPVPEISEPACWLGLSYTQYRRCRSSHSLQRYSDKESAPDHPPRTRMVSAAACLLPAGGRDVRADDLRATPGDELRALVGSVQKRGSAPTARVIGLSMALALRLRVVERGIQNMLVQGDIVINRQIGDVFDFVADERNEPKYN